MESPFFRPGLVTSEGQLASLHVSRDHSIPTILSTQAINEAQAGYAEGVVTNTKFGSFPHSTLIGVPWGSQVRASKVDTGTRGWKDGHARGQKRKANALSSDNPSPEPDSVNMKEAVQASSGFIYVLPPTPESWTTSLPHRTQVVYTPDYSYILQRIRVRPGSVLIEAGSGSGSFTHAAARAVFTGQSGTPYTCGKVFSYEFHPERHQKIQREMTEHSLSSIVYTTHRDVYQGGFLYEQDPDHFISPKANAIFLDLPAPWEALPHLTRQPSDGKASALDPSSSVHICTFSPCIEQVQKTITVMRKYGWTDIEMVELQQRRIDVRRDFTGLKYDGMRSVNVAPATIDEAVMKLREAEEKLRELQTAAVRTPRKEPTHTKQQDAAKLLFREGSIIHRSEPELKTHTSYLVFAAMPRSWTEEDEAAAIAVLGQEGSAKPLTPKSQRQLKREAKLRKKQKDLREVNGHV